MAKFIIQFAGDHPLSSAFERPPSVRNGSRLCKNPKPTYFQGSVYHS
jgi:hypothetical protein